LSLITADLFSHIITIEETTLIIRILRLRRDRYFVDRKNYAACEAA
jgi:hypothetical protein